MKNVLVTGASRGIGKECAKAFLKNGYRVFVNYNKSENEAKAFVNEYGGILVKCDVTKASQIEDMYSYITENYGGIDILINNAGVSQIKMLCDTEMYDYDFIFDTNMRSVYEITKKFMPYMIKNKYGKIINISSMWGISGASCEVLYSASKAAVIGFTKALAKELGPSNINVNCVAPGVIMTDMNKDIDGEILKTLEDETPLGRIGMVDDVSKTVLFLASDEASFITGQVISVDGGITV